jgi:hypothetical protein
VSRALLEKVPQNCTFVKVPQNIYTVNTQQLLLKGFAALFGSTFSQKVAFWLNLFPKGFAALFGSTFSQKVAVLRHFF